MYRKYDVISHVMYELGNNENDTYKSPNIIEYYDIAEKRFIVEYNFIREKVIEIQCHSY